MARTYSHPKRYTAAEDERLRAVYIASTQAELLTAFPGRTLASIRNRAGELRLLKIASPITKWTPEKDEVLRAYYPDGGAEAVAKRLGINSKAVKRRAGYLKVYSRKFAQPRPGAHPRTTEHSPFPKAANTLKPLLVGAKPSEPVKRSPGTPNLNAQKASTKAAATPKPSPYVTAAEIRALPAAHPARLAYTVAAHRGAAAATEAFHAAMKQAA